MLNHSTVTEGFHDYESDISSRDSNAISLQELDAQRPCVYIALVTTLLLRLAPPPGNSGLQHIVETWKEPDSKGSFQFEWRDDFSRDIVHKNCHSHNDYWRAVPLYGALAAGCVSVEADIWLTDDEELLVSHSWKSTTPERTLKSLYLDPLTNILDRRNVTTAGDADEKTGVFDSDPRIAVVLVIDFKSDGAATWPVLLQQLAPLREKDWLTRYDGETLHQGALTIVGTGNAPFDLIQRDSTNRYVFFDAPLLSVAEPKYNSTNTYYASAPIRGAVGKLWFNKMSSSQISAAREQVKVAQNKGLKSRYWDTPSWPIGRRDEVWEHLIDVDTGVLNVDGLTFLMTSKRSSSHRSFRLSNQGFQPLNNGNMDNRTTDIPLQTVVSHTPTQSSPISQNEKSEKGHMFSRGGRRKLAVVDSRTGAPLPPPQVNEEKTALNRMGRIYTRILNWSIVTRYIIYVTPIALLLAIPIILSQTGTITGSIGGTNQKKFWIWIEIIWLSFWVMKVVAHFLPKVFEFLIGVVSPGVRKYAQLLRAVEKPLSFVLWMIVNQATFPALVRPVPGRTGDKYPGWINTMQSVLLALLVCTIIILAERVLIQLISISYHRKQFDDKIKESKRNIYLLGVLYDTSRALFPAYCNEFAEEDYIIQDTILDLGFGSKKGTAKHGRSGSRTPMRIIQEVGRDAGRIGDKITSVFGTIASEITGKKVFDTNSAHSIVITALERNKSAEALSKRIWMSMVVEGKNELYLEDLVEVMGPGRQEEAEECFAAIDRDGNGDISLEEMILTVTDYARQRKSINSSMHDVDQAINALDGLIMTIALIVCIFVFVAFLAPEFRATLATSATALLSLSFVFATTAQEVLGSCIFLFVKHPYDIGDRVDITTEQLTVEHIQLLYTVFKRVTNGKTVQIPNIVLNSLWVENITRSKAMREQVSVFCDFTTSFEDINLLKLEMTAFVRDPANAREFHPDIDIEVVSIAEMNKLELRVEIRHKSNWSNESLRASRRSKFMCALVVALRKVPINGPAGGDAALGSQDKPTWSVAVPPAEAIAAYQKYLDTADAGRLQPLNQSKEQDTGASTGTDYLGIGTEGNAISALNNRRPGLDTIRDDTWDARGDETSTIGRPSTDQRPDLDEVRGLLRKASSVGKRKGGATLSPYGARSSVETTRQNPPPPLPLHVVPSGSHGSFAPPPPPSQSPLPPPPRSTAPGSPSSISTGQVEEYSYQTMAPPPRSQSRPHVPQVEEDEGERQWNANVHARAPSSNSNNPFRTAGSPQQGFQQFKRE
ncbi:serine threonine protein kinase [Stemphylium lycopersici]|nr:serine threonine protein kinase [Stemphylium lycopersici]